MTAGSLYMYYGYIGGAEGGESATNAVGVFQQRGGISTVEYSEFRLGECGNTGVYEISGGILDLRGYITGGTKYLRVGSGGEGILKLGNENTVGTGRIIESLNGIADDGSYDKAGYGVYLQVRSSAESKGTVIGWGEVGLRGQLINNGRVVANGYGTSRALDFSSVGDGLFFPGPVIPSPQNNRVTNNIENEVGENNGWFAKDKGKLILPMLQIGAGNGRYNWGEGIDDIQIDLINSVSMGFEDSTDGFLSVSLLDTNYKDVPGMSQFAISDSNWKCLGVWSFEPLDGLDFSSVDLVFRYDDTLIEPGIDEEKYVRVWKYYEGIDIWKDVTTGLADASSKLVYANDIKSLSYIMITIPEPATINLIGLGILILMRSSNGSVKNLAHIFG